MLNRDLSGKIAVVTGGSRGIGRYIAGALHEAGATVAITARHSAPLETAADSIGSRCRPYVCDQRQPEAVEQMAAAVVNDLGAPDILVNNAGVVKGGNVVDMSLETWHQVIETNLTGVFLVTKAFLPHMLEKPRGDIFMIGSMSAKKGDPGTSAYNASKFGLHGFSQALMHEVRRNNIRVVVLNPSAVNTGEDTGPRWGPGLHLHAADIADTIVHLACLPGRTMVRDLEILGTNPFSA